MTPESTLVRALLLESSKRGLTLFRNNTGRLPDINGRWVTYGLCAGSPDLVGWMPLTIGPAHVGRTIAVFVGLECKTAEGRLRPEQRAFLAALTRAGGIARVVRSVEDLPTTSSGCDR